MVTESSEVLDALVLQKRKQLVAAWERACGWPYATHVDVHGPQYQDVVEGRDYLHHPPSSSCGDLAHWGYEQVGLHPPWINRASMPGGWRVGRNVNTLVYPPIGTCTEAQEWTPYAAVDGGDVLIVSNRWPQGSDAHVICVLARVVDGGHVVFSTAEYGNEHGDPSRVGSIKQHALRTGHLLGAKRIRVWISLDRVVRAMHAR